MKLYAIFNIESGAIGCEHDEVKVATILKRKDTFKLNGEDTLKYKVFSFPEFTEVTSATIQLAS